MQKNCYRLTITSFNLGARMAMMDIEMNQAVKTTYYQFLSTVLLNPFI
jgi:hypothetical protein